MARCTKAAQRRARCTKAAQCRARYTKAAQRRARCTKAAQCRAWQAGGVCTTGIARASTSGQLPRQARYLASCMQWCAGCMIIAQGSAGGFEAAARCGGGRCPSRRWPEHAHWPQSCHLMFKVCALCCNASSKWAVSGSQCLCLIEPFP